MSYINEKNRVFWHEIGHYIAACFNQLYYGWFGTESITLIKQQIGYDRYDYKGAHEPIKPENYDPTEPIKQPAAKIACQAYGCIFQVIWHGDGQLTDCFDQNVYANGYDDFRDVAGVAARFKIYPPHTKPIYDCITEHFEKIRNNPEFKELFAVDISSLIESEEDQFNIDIEKIKILVTDFLKKHETYYIQLVEHLRLIIR